MKAKANVDVLKVGAGVFGLMGVLVFVLATTAFFISTLATANGS